MIPYYLLLLIVLLMLYKYYMTKKEVYYRIIFLILFLFVGLRGNGDGDYFTYLEYSNAINSLSDVLNIKFPMEIGFRIISYIKNILFLPDQTVIISMAFISIYCTYIFINEKSSNKILSVLIYLPILLRFDYHSSRSAVAAALACLVYLYIEKKDKKKALIFTIIAFSFHKSVVILLFMPIIFYLLKSNNKKRFIVLYFSFCILFTCISFLPELLLFLKSNFTNMYITKLYLYFFDSVYSYPINILDPRVILALLFAIVGIYLWKDIESGSDSLLYTVSPMIGGFFILLFFKESTIFAYRFYSFFERFSICSIPICLSQLDLIISKHNNKSKLLQILFEKKAMSLGFIYVLFYIGIVIINMVPYNLCI